MSDFSRSVAAQGSYPTSPSSSSSSSSTSSSTQQPTLRRRRYPEPSPHICLAFLSCCGRTDLLHHTLAGAIRHMEEDEPSYLRYEIAWVDNGSGRNKTDAIEQRFQIDYALPLPENTGLAYGMNLLVRDLCQAPYILLLEEDWLYLDDLVAPQTKRRKYAVATAIALVEQRVTSFDLREVMGVFLRPETYNHFMKFPFQDVWEETTLNVKRSLPETAAGVDPVVGEDDNGEDEADVCDSYGECDDNDDDDMDELIQYQIVCSDPSTQSQYIWGSYTNGAGLYRRDALKEVGRMYGEPGDAFHDRYAESNYAYRAGLHFCHAAIRLAETPCQDLADPVCAAAFYHIGGGRGTRPMKAQQSKCATDLWNFVGTPILGKFEILMGDKFDMCSKEELDELKDIKKQLQSAAEYRKEVEERNTEVFEKERLERQKMISNAQIMKQSDPESVREQVDWMKDYTDEEIWEAADRMERMAQSPHPLKGFWDGHGRPLV